MYKRYSQKKKKINKMKVFSVFIIVMIIVVSIIKNINRNYIMTIVDDRKENIETMKNGTEIEETIQEDKYITASLVSKKEYPDEWLEDFNKKIIELQKEFPSGTYWNHAGSMQDGNSVTNTPCNHSKDGELYCNSYHGNSDNAYDKKMTSVQCLGFASMLSDKVFGTDAEATRFENYDDIRIGDQARINNNSHTVFIIDKTDDYVVVAECNADYKTCIINWGRKIPREKLKGWYITRWK